MVENVKGKHQIFQRAKVLVLDRRMQKYDRRRLPSSIATYSVENGLSCMKIIWKKILGGVGIRTRGLSHAKRTLYHWVTPPFLLSLFFNPVKIQIFCFYNEFPMGLFWNTYLTKKVIKPFLKSLVGPILFDRNFMSSFFLSKNVTYLLSLKRKSFKGHNLQTTYTI